MMSVLAGTIRPSLVGKVSRWTYRKESVGGYGIKN